MKNYSIKVRTDSYTANRDAMFKGKCEITLLTNLTLKQAYKKLLDMFNNIFELEYYAVNWSIAIKKTKKLVFCANKTLIDKTRSFDYDGRRYYIEEERDNY